MRWLTEAVRWFPSNNSMQLTALRAAPDAERSAVFNDVPARSIVARCAIHARIVVLPPLLDEWREVGAAYGSSTVNPAQ